MRITLTDEVKFAIKAWLADNIPEWRDFGIVFLAGVGLVWGWFCEGFGMIWAWFGDGFGMVWAWFGHGLGVVWGWLTWLGHGLDMV